MVPPGREFDPMLRMYFDAEEKPQPTEARPWRYPEGDVAPVEDFAQDTRLPYLKAALEFFGKTEEEAQGTGPPEGVVLDLACGEGFMARAADAARRLAQSGRFSRVFAADVDWQQLEAARAAAEEEGTGPDHGLLLLRADAQALPFRQGQVDFAWCGMGLHKMEDEAVALASIASVLKPGGRLFASTFGSDLPGMKAEDLEKKARDAGFSQVEVEQRRLTERILRAIK